MLKTQLIKFSTLMVAKPEKKRKGQMWEGMDTVTSLHNNIYIYTQQWTSPLRSYTKWALQSHSFKHECLSSQQLPCAVYNIYITRNFTNGNPKHQRFRKNVACAYKENPLPCLHVPLLLSIHFRGNQESLQITLSHPVCRSRSMLFLCQYQNQSLEV